MRDLENEIRDAVEQRLCASPVWKPKTHQQVPKAEGGCGPVVPHRALDGAGHRS